MEKVKKYSGVKFLKLDNPLFNKAKRFERKSSNIQLPIKNNISTIDNKRKVSLNPMKMEDEKTPNSILNKYSKISSIRKNSTTLKELSLLKISQLKKVEGKKDGEMLLTKFSKYNLKPLKLINNASTKNFMTNKNNNVSNIISNNLSKINISKNISKKNKINFNSIKNNEKGNKDNKYEIVVTSENQKEINNETLKMKQ